MCNSYHWQQWEESFLLMSVEGKRLIKWKRVLWFRVWSRYHCTSGSWFLTGRQLSEKVCGQLIDCWSLRCFLAVVVCVHALWFWDGRTREDEVRVYICGLKCGRKEENWIFCFHLSVLVNITATRRGCCGSENPSCSVHFP